MVSFTSNTFLVVRALLISLLVVLPMGWLAMRLAWRWRLIDEPNSAPHKQHKRPTPLAGGIALYASLLICEAWLGLLDDPVVRASMLAGFLVFLFGLMDDLWNLPPIVKLFGQTTAAALLIRAGVYVQIFESPEFFFNGTGPLYIFLDWLVTIFWMVGITNAFNFVDSMDGLAVGLGAMSAAFFVPLTLEAGQITLMQHSVLILGVCVGLYLYNSPPALLFLGDSGAQALGFILAAMAIAYRSPSAFQTSSWFAPVILFSVPIFDTLLIIISRLRRGKSIYTAGQDHTYHRLSRLLGSSSRAVLVMQISALVLCCLAILGLNQPPTLANLIYMVILIAGAAALIFLEQGALLEKPQ
jgi:UDP-GlcNAc:undecaprenyl-phosphate GlcNAc-1-phosphate transferase